MTCYPPKAKMGSPGIRRGGGTTAGVRIICQFVARPFSLHALRDIQIRHVRAAENAGGNVERREGIDSRRWPLGDSQRVSLAPPHIATPELAWVSEVIPFGQPKCRRDRDDRAQLLFHRRPLRTVMATITTIGSGAIAQPRPGHFGPACIGLAGRG